jgi:hypothetical protein
MLFACNKKFLLFFVIRRNRPETARGKDFNKAYNDRNNETWRIESLESFVGQRFTLFLEMLASKGFGRNIQQFLDLRIKINLLHTQFTERIYEHMFRTIFSESTR